MLQQCRSSELLQLTNVWNSLSDCFNFPSLQAFKMIIHPSEYLKYYDKYQCTRKWDLDVHLYFVSLFHLSETTSRNNSN